MTTDLRRRRSMTAATVLVPALLLTACGSNGATTPTAGADGPSPGITDTSVVIGQTWPLTGAAAGPFGGIQAAIAAEIGRINDAGGVTMGDGLTRTIDLRVLDDAFDPAKAVANARQLVQQDEVFTIFAPVGTGQVAAVADYTEDRGVPLALVASAASTWGSPEYEWTIGFQPPSSVDSIIWADQLTRTDPTAKVAFLTDSTEFGAEAVQVFRDRLAELGSTVEVVAVQTYQSTDATMDSQVTALAASGADVFFNVGTARPAAQAIAAIADSAWDPQQILTSTANGEAVIDAAGAANMTGVSSTFFMKDPTDPAWDDDEWMTSFRATLAERAPSASPTEQSNVFAVLLVDVLVDALERTPEPTRAAFMESLRTMDFAGAGLLPGLSAVTGTEDPYPIESLQLGVFDGTRWQLDGEIVGGEGLTPRPAGTS